MVNKDYCLKEKYVCQNCGMLDYRKLYAEHCKLNGGDHVLRM